MSDSSTPVFSEAEIELLAKTADAMSAYSGKPVLAETGTTEGVSWAVFGVPLGTDEEVDDETVVWQMGGAGVRLLGNAGGLAPGADDVYACRLLWAIQITETEGERFIKLDDQSEVIDWSDELADLLPFGIDPDPDWDEDEDEDEDGEDDGIDYR